MGAQVDNSFTWAAKKLFNLEALNVLIVGGTGGLGRSISRALAAGGANVTVVGQTFRDSDVKNINFVQCDISSIKSTRKLAKELDVSKTDVILFTAGIFASTKRQETIEGLEKDMAVSYLNRLVMIKELAPKIRTTKNSFGFFPRVFVMAYPGDGQLGNIDDLNTEKSYGAMKAHMNTVAGNEALVYDSAEKYTTPHFYGLNPGIVKTNIRSNFLGENSWKSTALETVVGWFTRTPEQYGAGIAPLLIAPELDSCNGAIFNNNGKRLVRSKGMSGDYAKAYVKSSEDLLESKSLN